MPFSASKISYRDTNNFSALAVDYAEGKTALRPFYNHPPSIEGIKKIIEERKAFTTNRSLLVTELKRRYAGMVLPAQVSANIDALLQGNCFTVCTAHQPNIFTGHLYFVYKILHAVRLAGELNEAIPQYHFVPIYYMGSEDADLDELGEITVNTKKYKWHTKQTGAVGRMLVDKDFVKLADELEAQLAVEKYGTEIMPLVKKAYTVGKTIEQATFELVHELFGHYGLVTVLPDSPVFKAAFAPVIKKELEEQFSKKAVDATLQAFPAAYKVQVEGRELNLFYLEDGLRERIEKKGDELFGAGKNSSFTNEEIKKLLDEHPERFSPNVILRPLLQETLLPNVAFIGGGGEIAYWLELKKVFEAAGLPYPVLVLRNSFMVLPQKAAEKISALDFSVTDLFGPIEDLLTKLVKRDTKLKLNLAEEKLALIKTYSIIRDDASAIDPTLEKHVWALQEKAVQRVEELEKKMLRAEKKKYDAQQRQLGKIKEKLFPAGSLQERVDNLLPYYAAYGSNFIEAIYEASAGLAQQFTIITESR
ncbi:MAG: bacillithiol biosynthesis cysteine-adding enzyme BshC [Ferruginibacter sp.]